MRCPGRMWVVLGLAMLAAAARVGLSQTTAPANLPALIHDLGSPDFAVRDAAQKALITIPPEQVAVLRDAQKAATDPEVKARLEARIAEMELYTALHPKPITVQVAGELKDLANTINDQLGLHWVEFTGQPRFTVITARDQPVWEVLRLVSEKTQLLIIPRQNSGPPGAGINILPLSGQARPFFMTDGIAVIPQAVNTGGGGRRGADAAGEVRVTCRMYLDPRVHLANYGRQIRVERAVDQDGKPLAQIVQAEVSTTAPNQPVSVFSCSATLLRTPEVKSIKELRGTVDAEVVVQERNIVIDLEKEATTRVAVPNGTLIVTKYAGPSISLAIERGAASVGAVQLQVALFGEDHQVTSNIPLSAGQLTLNPGRAKTLEFMLPERTRPTKLPIEIQNVPVALPALPGR